MPNETQVGQQLFQSKSTQKKAHRKNDQKEMIQIKIRDQSFFSAVSMYYKPTNFLDQLDF